MPDGSEGTAIPFNNRGFSYIDDKNRTRGNWSVEFDIYRFKDPIGDKTINNCAMLCDQDPNCKSFTVENTNTTGNDTICKLRGKFASGDNTVGSSDHYNSKNYDKNSSVNKPTERIVHQISTPEDHTYADYTAYHACRGRNCCDRDHRDRDDRRTTKYYSGMTDRDGFDKCRSNGAASSACYPGVVTSVNFGDSPFTVKCGYSRLDPDWVHKNWASLKNYFDSQNVENVKQTHCEGMSFTDLAASSECRDYYGTNNLNSELLKRIESTGNGWANNPPQRDFVQQVVADEVIQGRAATDVSSRAKALIRNFCTANPNDPKCGCYNAVNKGLSGCQATPTAPGCAELVALGNQFDTAPPEFKPIFQQMKNSVNAMCLSENCKTVRGATTNAAGILLPGTVPGGDCSSNFNVCLTKLSVGQMTGGSIDSSCKQTLNIPASSTPSAASGTSITSGPSGTQGSVATPSSSSNPSGSSNPTKEKEEDDKKNKDNATAVGGISSSLICCCIVIMIILALLTMAV